MLRDEIYEVYENMGPDEAARKRMLKNIRSAALQKEFAQKEKKRRMKKQGAKLGFRLAAGAAAGCLLIGTAAYAVYYFGLKDMGTGREKVHDLSVPVEELGDIAQEDIPKKEVDMISLAGVAGSPEHKADAEWQEFLKGYDQDESILAAVGNEPTGFEEEYGEYLCYSQEMADKIDEICKKYGLWKLTGFELAKDYDGLCNGAGVGDFLRGKEEEAKAEFLASERKNWKNRRRRLIFR